MITITQAYNLGYQHGAAMARDSGSSDPGCEGWDGLLINSDVSFAIREFGWCDAPSEESKRLMRTYCQGAQAGADSYISKAARASILSAKFPRQSNQ